MQQFELGIIGIGYIGGIRAVACADSPQVSALHIAENRPERLNEVKRDISPASATSDYRDILRNPDIKAVMICSTPEGTHYTFTKEALLADKHVFVEKPLAQTTAEADELIELAEQRKLKLTVGYTQRFNPRFAYIRKCLREGIIGEPVTCLISRQITLKMGKKITSRFKASPAVMEGDARPRLPDVVPAAAQAHQGLLADRRKAAQAERRIARPSVDPRDDGRRDHGHRRRRLDPAVRLQQLFPGDDRGSSAPKGP